MHDYVASRFHYQRRQSLPVRVGSLSIGGDAPLLIQSMCTTPTQDIPATVAQCIQLAEAGCELVRITAPGIKDAQALAPIRKQFSNAGFRDIPLCADIHFMPKAAMEAVEHVEKVRINPGNFADKKSFAVLEYSDQEYQDELDRISERFTPLVARAQELGRALRIGSNHGSLSDRIMNRFGDTPEGMVESAMEFIRIAEAVNFQDIIISMKSSNPKVMIQAYRFLCSRLYDHGKNYPLHLGVTEAGDGEDARVKSACGIGALLEDGIGDTVRVSLTEDPCAEIPVARDLCQRYNKRTQQSQIHLPNISEHIDPFTYQRRPSAKVNLQPQDISIGESETVAVCTRNTELDVLIPADLIIGENTNNNIVFLDINADEPYADLLAQLSSLKQAAVIGLRNCGELGTLRAYRLLHACILESHQRTQTPLHPIIISIFNESDLLHLSSVCGALLADGCGDALYFPDADHACNWSFTILQAMKVRMTRADYVACPSCGRTLFDLMDVTADIRAVTDHLDDVTIAIMGCVVNGPGEMADADFGYVGSGPGKITLYRGKEAVQKNIPEVGARDRLIQLIKDCGKWRDRQ